MSATYGELGLLFTFLSAKICVIIVMTVITVDQPFSCTVQVMVLKHNKKAKFPEKLTYDKAKLLFETNSR